jgi:hypothetical protein
MTLKNLPPFATGPYWWVGGRDGVLFSWKHKDGLLMRVSESDAVVGTHQSDKISHIDMEDDRIDTVISHIISPYSISISRMTMSI